MHEKEHSWKIGDTENFDYGNNPYRIKIQNAGSGGILAEQLAKEDIFMPKYKFNEDKLLAEFRMYVDKTYTQHYAQNKFQATEFVIDSGHGMGFALGNVMKYSQRYGKKQGFNRQDLLKVLHYALIALHVHDQTNPRREGDQ